MIIRKSFFDRYTPILQHTVTCDACQCKFTTEALIKVHKLFGELDRGGYTPPRYICTVICPSCGKDVGFKPKLKKVKEK